MMILCDCVTQEVKDNSALFRYIKHLSEICEVKAIAYKDLHDSLKGKLKKNNLFLVWSAKFN
jgi:hypothetical protein